MSVKHSQRLFRSNHFHFNMHSHQKLQTRLQTEPHIWLNYFHLQGLQPAYRNFRAAGVHHSLADISKTLTRLGYALTQRFGQGLALAVPWQIGQES